jgi:uncharacterized protein YcgI (DUF1989 family)
MELVEEVVIPRNTGKALTLREGEHIRIIGESTVDFVAFNLHNLRERFDQARTKVMQGKIFISKGDRLFSKSNNIMLTIIEDTFQGQGGRHDLQKGMCSALVYRLTYEAGKYPEHLPANRDDLPEHGCWENLSEALKPWNVAPEDIPSPFNVFQSMEIDTCSGVMRFSRIDPLPGTYVELKAEMDLLVGFSACPTGGRGKDVQVQLYR